MGEDPAGKPLAKLGLPSGISVLGAKLAVRILSALFIACAALHANRAFAVEFGPGSVRLQGSVEWLEVEVHDGTIGGVLAAMRREFAVRYRSSVPLNDAISGAYVGSLTSVIARILDGYDFVIKHERSGVEVAIFGRSSGRPAPPAVRHGRCGRSAGHQAACQPI